MNLPFWLEGLCYRLMDKSVGPGVCDRENNSRDLDSCRWRRPHPFRVQQHAHDRSRHSAPSVPRCFRLHRCNHPLPNEQRSLPAHWVADDAQPRVMLSEGHAVGWIAVPQLRLQQSAEAPAMKAWCDHFRKPAPPDANVAGCHPEDFHRISSSWKCPSMNHCTSATTCSASTPQHTQCTTDLLGCMTNSLGMLRLA